MSLRGKISPDSREVMEEDQLPKRFVFSILLFSITGLIVFVATFIPAINNFGVVYESTSPMNPSWLGMSCFILSLFYVLWISIFWRTMSRFAIWMWLVIGISSTFFGFCTMIGYAVLPNDRLSAGLSFLLWMVPGALISYVNLLLRKSEKRNKCCTISCCCSSFFAMPFVVFVYACAVGIFIQALSSANDQRLYPPIGQVYQVPVTSSLSLGMHLACVGSKSTNRTWIFEHGGGSNSVSMKHVADRVAERGYRACVYDRLGYGWSSGYLTGANDTADFDARMLRNLLSIAQESGPFVCVGHSAGAEKCLRLAMLPNSQVSGIGFVDGYPDLVRVGFDQMGTFNGGPLIGVLKMFAFLVGPTGFTRGILGATSSTFVPKDGAAAFTALYAQNRYWYSQLWDVVASVNPNNQFVYERLQGTRNATSGVITYGRNLNVTVGVFPAFSTVSFDCSAATAHRCCTDQSNNCVVFRKERQQYNEQSELYAQTIGIQPGLRVIGPVGSEHGYPYHETYAGWLVNQLVSLLG